MARICSTPFSFRSTWAIRPGGPVWRWRREHFGTIFSLLLVGQLARFGFNTRIFIGPAFVITAVSLWQMSHWNMQIGVAKSTGPVVLQGIGTGLVFPQLSAISLSAVPRERMGYASSLFNMMRNTGAAIGISFLTAIFVSHQQIHQSRLTEHFSIFDAWQMSEQPRRMPGSPVFWMLQMQTRSKAGLGDGLWHSPGASRGAGLQRHLPDAGRMVAIDDSVLLPAPQSADDRDGRIRPLSGRLSTPGIRNSA